MPNPLTQLALDLCSYLKSEGYTVSTAESCTGGMVSASITEIAGSSAVLKAGYVTYSNQAKIDMLGVDAALLNHPGPGAVSEEVAAQMAQGALAKSKTDIAVSITGIAGPQSDDSKKPVGMVMFGLAKKNQATQTFHKEFGSELTNIPIGKRRAKVRELSTAFALHLLMS